MYCSGIGAITYRIEIFKFVFSFVCWSLFRFETQSCVKEVESFTILKLTLGFN